MRISTLKNRLAAKIDSLDRFQTDLEDIFGKNGFKLEYFPGEACDDEDFGYLNVSVKLRGVWDPSNSELKVLKCFRGSPIEKFFALSGAGVGGGCRDVGFYEIPLK